jgi:hypothetical protein
VLPDATDVQREAHQEERAAGGQEEHIDET